MLLNSKIKSLYMDVARLVRGASSRNDVPSNATPDLKDSAPSWNYMPDGMPVSTVLIPADFARGADEPARFATQLLVALSILIGSGFAAVLAGFFMSPAIAFVLFVVAGLISTLIVLNEDAKGVASLVVFGPMTCGIYVLYRAFALSIPSGGIASGEGRFRAHSRDETLYLQAQQDSAALGEQAARFARAKKLRAVQAERAEKDKTKFILLGEAQGEFAQHGDLMAPDAGQIVGETVTDFERHLIIFGETGSGKTAGAIRPIIRQYCSQDKAGLAVFCGKGQLPKQIKAKLGDSFKLLNPAHDKIALFAGMDAIEVTDALAVKNPKGDGEGNWFSSAREFLFQNAVLLYSVYKSGQGGLEYRWTPSCLRAMAGSNNMIKGESVHSSYRLRAIEILQSIPESERGFLTSNALRYMDAEAKTLIPAKAFSSTIDYIGTWLSPLFNNEQIAAWASTSEEDGGIDVSRVLEGLRIGLDVDSAVYGEKTGDIISALVRQRIYVALKRRGDGWKAVEGQTSVWLVMDEVQILWKDFDGDMTAILRSLGGTQIVATQSVDSLVDTMGKERAETVIGNFVGGLIGFKSTPATYALYSQRAGYVARPYSSILDETMAKEVVGVGLKGDLWVEYLMPRGTNGLISDSGASIHKLSLRQKLVRAVTDSGQSGQIIHSNQENKGLVTYSVATAEELDGMLAEPFTAVWVGMRAGVRRADIIKVQPE